MNSKIPLRIASIIMFLHLIGHTFGHVNWKQATEPARQEVIKQMIGDKLPFMGAVRSLAEYYDGYGYATTLGLFFIAAMLWIAAGSAAENTSLVRKILILVSAILLAWGIDELVFFFPFAAAFSLLATLLTIIAIFNLEKG